MTLSDIEVGAIYVMGGIKRRPLRPVQVKRFDPKGPYEGGLITIVTLPGDGRPGGTESTFSAAYFVRKVLHKKSGGQHDRKTA